MIAGPSSSGKTSFSHRLSIQLRTLGVHPHPIALDNYFVDRDETPLDENGNYNFECLEAIDVKLFNQQMNELLAGKRVELPTFNFVTGQKEYKGDYKQLGEDDILVIEGIHGLAFHPLQPRASRRRNSPSRRFPPNRRGPCGHPRRRHSRAHSESVQSRHTVRYARQCRE